MFWNYNQKQRVRFEDALKHIYDCEYRKVEASILSLSGILHIKDKKVTALLSKMEKRGLVRIVGDGVFAIIACIFTIEQDLVACAIA